MEIGKVVNKFVTDIKTDFNKLNTSSDQDKMILRTSLACRIIGALGLTIASAVAISATVSILASPGAAIALLVLSIGAIALSRDIIKVGLNIKNPGLKNKTKLIFGRDVSFINNTWILEPIYNAFNDKSTKAAKA